MRVLPQLFLGLVGAGLGALAAADIQLKISSSPTNASQVLDRRLASLSIEFSYLPTYGGNLSAPNVLTRELVARLEERTGLGPDLRPGGISVDSSVFSPNASALELTESSSGGIWKTTYGPAYFESLAVFPSSTRIVWSANLGNNTIAFAQTAIAAAIKYIGWERIYAFELGNEADHYAGGSRPTTWAAGDYTAQFLGWTNYLMRNLTLPQHMFQAGGFAEDPKPAAPITTVDIVQDGIETTNAVKLYSQHTYQYSTCDPVRNAIATLPNLINHQNITAYLDLWRPQIAAARALGREFVVGEYSSVSCSGKENVTDTFGQALWLADTILYGAFLNVSRLYLHQGATLVLQSSSQTNSPGYSWYDLWYPAQSDRFGPPHASTSYVAYLLVAEAVGSSGASRLSLIDVPGHPQLAAYAIWDASERTHGPARLVLLNLAGRNETTSATDAAAAAVTVDLSTYADAHAQVKRMSAPGLSEKNSTLVTWAGQNYYSGVAAGKEVTEGLSGGKVTVQGSEGVLVFFH